MAIRFGGTTEAPDHRAIRRTQAIHPAIGAAENHASLPDAGRRVNATAGGEMPLGRACLLIQGMKRVLLDLRDEDLPLAHADGAELAAQLGVPALAQG